MSFTFNRLGQQTTITDGQGTRTFTYNANLQLASELVAAAVTPWTNELVRLYDTLGRPAGFDAGPDYSVRYGYDPLGHFATVTSLVSLVPFVVNYSYVSGSDLLSGYDLASGTNVFTARKTFEPNRNLIATVSNLWNGLAVSPFEYRNDELARRVKRIDNTSVTNVFGYNLRSELVSALMSTNTYGYVYDPIGNRQVASKVSGLASNVSTYAANPLNQYTNILEGGVPTTPHYDSDGNLLSYGGWNYAWDAENRLVLASNATTVVSNSYDYMSRRIGKTVHTNNSGSWILASGFSFTYDGWAMIREVSSATTKHYVYGLDLSGTLQGAGTIGGILARSEVGGLTSNVCYYAYDANGNVTDLVGADGSVAAHYQYDPYGNTVLKTGTLADVNQFRFSTKYRDVETGLYYYGHRFYNTGLGRWASRDPIGESGGYNAYMLCANNPICSVDDLGLCIPGAQREHTEGGTSQGGTYTGAFGIGITQRQLFLMLEIKVQCACERSGVVISFDRVTEECRCQSTEVTVASGVICCNGSYNWTEIARTHETHIATTRTSIWTHSTVLTIPETESSTFTGCVFDGVMVGISICGQGLSFVNEQRQQCAEDCRSRR